MDIMYSMDVLATRKFPSTNSKTIGYSCNSQEILNLIKFMELAISLLIQSQEWIAYKQ